MITPRKVKTHEHEGKVIPSGFFSLEGAEHVGAVMFSNSGTVLKFTRMGQLGRHRNDRIRVLRTGTCHNPDPSSATPSSFSYDVGDPLFPEDWGQGLSMFHNPHALLPVDRRLFPDIAHHRMEGGMIYSDLQDFHPYTSATVITLK